MNIRNNHLKKRINIKIVGIGTEIGFMVTSDQKCANVFFSFLLQVFTHPPEGYACDNDDCNSSIFFLMR